MKNENISKIQYVEGLNMSIMALVKPIDDGDFEVYINSDVGEDKQAEILNKAKSKIASALKNREAAEVAGNNGFFALPFPHYKTFDIP